MRRWEEFRDQIEALGVGLVAISADSPQEIRTGRIKHGAKFPILSDEKLEVSALFNLIQERAITGHGGLVTPIPVPTTILVDAEGIVRWIDRSEHYSVRSHPERVLAAIRAGLEVA